MVRVDVKDGYIHVGSERVPFLQGEFHFWRNTRCFWPRIISSIKDIGFKHVATYVEWDFHRITPNGTRLADIKYDFTGKTDQQRDLAGYLDMIDKDETLWLTVRPGPYIYAETEFGGPPEEASDRHYHRLHPRFLELAGHYLNAVCKVLKPHLATNGGKIVLCQLDNEVSMIKNKGQIIGGGVDEAGSYANFLHEHYGGDLDSINRAYGTRWEGWDEVEPTLAPCNKKDFVAFIDSAMYNEWYCQKYFEWCKHAYQENGIDIPFYVNSTGGPFPHDPSRLKDTICMTDLYYVGALKTMLPYNAKFLKPTQPITASAEFRCGTFEVAMTDKRYLQQAALWMAYGFHGVNYFMIVDRHRWANCPIDAVGRPGTAQLYSIFKRICKAYNTLDYPRFANGLVSDINLVWWRKHAYTIKPDPTEPYNDGGQLDSDTTFNHMFRALLFGNMQFDMHVPGGRYNTNKPVLIYAAHDYCEPALAEEMLAHAHSGGTVVFYHNYPVKTINGDKIDTFSNVLVPARGVHRHSGPAMIQYGETDRESFPRVFSTTTSFMADYDISGLDGATPFHYMHVNAGYLVKAGKGKIVVLGFDVTPDSIHPIMNAIEITSPIKTKVRDVLCTVLKNGQEHVVGVVNLGTQAIDAVELIVDKAKIDLGKHATVVSLLQDKKVEITGNSLVLPLPAGEGDVLWVK